jgi:hypothetical protein
MVSGVPIPNCRGGVNGLAIAGDPDRHPPRWQEAPRHEIIPDAHRDGRANEPATSHTLGIFVMLFQDAGFGWTAAFSQARQP